MIESHAHISGRKFDGNFRYLTCSGSGIFSADEGDRPKLIGEMKKGNIEAVIEPAVGLDSNRAILETAERYPQFVFPAVGLHPTRTRNEKWQDRIVLEELSKRQTVVAIGETGLDFHYPRGEQHRLCQLRWFVFQILLAHRRGLPLILHIRNADRMTLAVLRLFRPFLHGGVAHCFQGSVKTANAFIRLGFSLGIGGVLLQDNDDARELNETVKSVPIEKILLETDSPYVHPACDVVSNAKKRAKVRNSPLILKAVAAKVAELKGLESGFVERKTEENTRRLFRLPVACSASGNKEAR